jgi:uncharacterized protein (TIGR03435 family)
MRAVAISMVAVLAGAVASPSLRAQNPSVESRFDAVSIKANTSKEPGIMSRPTPGRIFMGNAPVALLIEQAYRTDFQHLFEVPDWAKNERWDVTATYDQAQRADVPAMMQAMLAERFRLQVHRETRDIPVYVLERLRPDSLGPNLRPSTADCADRSGTPKCTMRIAPGSIAVVGNPWGMLRTNMGIGDRPVVDKTGLTGRYDFTLVWNATTILGSTDPGLPTTDKPSIFRAVEEQLGLRLRATREPVDVVVVDHIERPTEN